MKNYLITLLLILLNSSLYALELEVFPAQATVCTGNNILLKVVPYGAEGPFTFEWYKDSESVPFYASSSLEEGTVWVAPTSNTIYTVVVFSEVEGQTCNISIPVTVTNDYQVSDISFKNGRSLKQDPFPVDDNNAYYDWNGYSAFHWTGINGEVVPYTYVSGTKITIEQATIQACGDIVSGSNFEVKATASGNGNIFELISPIVFYSPTQNSISILDAEFQEVFPANIVDVYEPLTIDWYVRLDGGDWKAAGSSEHLIYVTFQAVDVTIENDGDAALKHFHSFYHLGCQAAKGLSNQDDIVLAIFNEFKDREVQRYKSSQASMGYWRDDDEYHAIGVGCTIADILLTYETGTCGAWSDFVKKLIWIQGIGNISTSSPIKRILITPSSPTGGISYMPEGTTKQEFLNRILTEFIPTLTDDQYLKPLAGFYYDNNTTIIDFYPIELLLVKDWATIPMNSFISSTHSTEIKFKYYEDVYVYFYDFNEATVTEAQGTDDPLRFVFANHAIMKYTSLSGEEYYFDPSYGKPEDINSFGILDPADTDNLDNGEIDWEDSNIDYIGSSFTIFNANLETLPTRWIWVYKQNQSGIKDINFEIITE